MTDFISADHSPTGVTTLSESDDLTEVIAEGRLRRQTFPKGLLITASGEAPLRAIRIDHGLVAILAMLDDGRCSGCGLAGPGDWLGALEHLDGPAVLQALCLTEVKVATIRMDDLVTAWTDAPQLSADIIRSLASQMGQTQQLLLCTHHHRLEARLATLLLRLADRLGDELHITQAVLSDMLSVQRTSITATMARMQANGSVRLSRGRLTIANWNGLQAMACGCNHAV